ncbi:MAG: NADH-quinone oxidoreductase subunit NuoN [Pseudomonadota bacterium]
MSFEMPQFSLALPEIVLLSALCVVLIIDLFVSDEKRVITFWLSLASLAATFAATLASEPVVRTLTFSASYVSDPLASVLKMAATLCLALVFIYSRDYLMRNALRKGEFYLLSLFGLLGIFVMVSANSLLTMYLGLEMLSLSLYALVAFDRNSRICAEAAMKYFVLGAIASGAFLYGISLIYGVAGTIQFDQLSDAIVQKGADDLGLWFGLAFLIVGLVFKFGGVPFHMWLPDVYQGSRTPVTIYLGSLSKIASFALAVRVLVDGLPALYEQWHQMLMVVAILSLALGNIVAIAQTNIKRMLAYSTISHVGFILLGFFAGNAEGYQAALFYTLTYVFTAAGAFGMIALLSKRGHEAESLSDFRGLNARSPWYAAIMSCFMLSMAGIPPWVGFWAKLHVIEAVLDAGRVAGGSSQLFLFVALAMVLFSVIGAFYYLRVLKFMYFDEPVDEADAPIDAGFDARAVLSANGLAVLAVGIAPGSLLALCALVIG